MHITKNCKQLANVLLQDLVACMLLHSLPSANPSITYIIGLQPGLLVPLLTPSYI
jgi:hypothetical protein